MEFLHLSDFSLSTMLLIAAVDSVDDDDVELLFFHGLLTPTKDE